MEKDDYSVVSFKNDRYAISDKDGNIIDDANGYGYKTKGNAYRVLSYKYLGGKQKASLQKRDYRKWINENPIHKGVIKEFDNLTECYFKEIFRGETTLNDIWKELEESHKITIPEFVKKEAIK